MQLKSIAHLSGLSGPLVFALDGETKPGTVIVHCIRFQTYHMPEELFKETTFDMVQMAADRRIIVLGNCFRDKK